MADDDDALLVAARGGDDEAMRKLLSRHQGRVFRFGMKMCRNEEDAKDVAQETLLAMARGIRDFRGASSLSTWLYAIARSACVKKRRKSKFAPMEEQSLDDAPDAQRIASTTAAPDEAAAAKQIGDAIDAAIAALDPKLREVLVLRDVEGLSATEVAEVLGVSVDAVKSRLHRARIVVRERLAPLLEPREASKAPGACPDIVPLFSSYVEGDVTPDRCAEMETHLAVCPRCRGACDALKRVLATCRTMPAGEVPQDVQNAVRAAVGRLA